MKSNCALYVRCSLEEQSEYGLASQLSELRVHAAKCGYSVKAELEFIDDGYSGADLGRPALTKLRGMIREKQVDVVMVHGPDRLARRLALQLLVIEECERAGVKLDFVSAPSTDSMEGRLLLNLLGSIAEGESPAGSGRWRPSPLRL
jgi:site-specific DNA recombinase